MIEVGNVNIRETTQYELPLLKSNLDVGYDIYPTHKISDNLINIGYDSLAKELATFKQIKIDGYVGINFEEVKGKLSESFKKINIEPQWINVEKTYKDEETIDDLVSPFLGGDDPVFGKVTSLNLIDFFDEKQLDGLVEQACDSLIIYYGKGASLVPVESSKLVYFEISKNEIQFRSRAGSINNLGATHADNPGMMYKRFYFVDWIVLNRHKNEIKDNIDYFIDGQRTENISWIEGSHWRSSIKSLLKSPIRVRPWFEPGVWGGQWIKDKIKGLQEDVVNYAWSFELILPENGVIIESSKVMLEFSFDFLMFFSGESVLGKDYDIYGYEFPIRFDFLDTYKGGNLSVQCHPQLSYIKEHFGENITQEETYYILDCSDDAHVYLGFQDGIDPKKFETELSNSIKEEKEVEITDFVQRFKSIKHELYLIPPGTIHSAGEGNLVLEISSTPYIFTFKMYDWLRPGLDGKPRPLNLKRGLDNVVFEYSGQRVNDELISKPRLKERSSDFDLYHLPTHKKHLYDVHRYILKNSTNIEMHGKAHVLSLVQGDKIEIIANGKSTLYNYAESILIPASVQEYTVKNLSQKPIMFVKAFIK
ncbi:class I mannose-6-phosphate isomerase [Flavivirga sp. 57AJ16]|uniref:class I mannose-6-phosphate isomerase n=1 Tax=Flavivirga sp. 57AJ16 TaxID=3025307 RepID=UPI0023650FAA|nr:class I mannose-6-phosphate isomerase [Flavivirga sp. 57AJ16]MDD7884497.1 class I mannose-6-phosphate isomerase [Flavivirga sp. 57AJ16]